MANTTDFAVEKPTVGGYRNTWGGTLNTGLDKLTELLALALPIGSIQMYPKITAPTATANGGTWLVCGGASVLRTGSGGYADLFAIIGTTYGSADSTHFNLPDLRARVPVGYNATTISSGTVAQRSGRPIASTTNGFEGHILTTGELSAHSHQIPATSHDHDIDDDTHAHVGLRNDEGAGTENASAVISETEHFHETFSNAGDVSESIWRNNGTLTNTSGSGIDGDRYGRFFTGITYQTGSKTTGITDSGHKHTFATNSVATGITSTEAEVIGITSTAPDTGSGASHNNMQPYQVVNYIILAKHPTFT
tara:strand:+ start:1569 stop:2492 length:924 start_codon:yes stop_codon:yes gene_type:complete